MTTRVLFPDVLDAPDLGPDTEVLVYDAKQPLPDDAVDADVFVVWGRPARLHDDDARRLTRVRLVQGLMAGAELLEAAGFREEAALCSGVGLHDIPVAEHALAMTLALVRRLPLCLEAQRESRWLHDIAGHQPLHHDGPVTSLIRARVLIWGFGSIATTLAPLLAALGAEVTGVATTAGERAGFRVVSADDVDNELPDTDVLVSILPGGDRTRQAIDARRLARLPEGAYVVNVGRGSVIDEDALVTALRSGHLGGAALDVMEIEPLPAESPLWQAPGVLLTPHCAGGRPVGHAEFVRGQIAALNGGGALRNRLR